MAETDDRVTKAAAMLAMRETRQRHFPKDLFDEHGWDALLLLYGQQRPMTPEAIADALNTGEEGIRRWLRHLENEQQVAAVPDGSEEAAYRLSDAAVRSMESFLDDMVVTEG